MPVLVFLLTGAPFFCRLTGSSFSFFPVLTMTSSDGHSRAVSFLSTFVVGATLACLFAYVSQADTFPTDILSDDLISVVDSTALGTLPSVRPVSMRVDVVTRLRSLRLWRLTTSYS